MNMVDNGFFVKNAVEMRSVFIGTTSTIARSARENICEHNRVKYYCKECGGNGICIHGKDKRCCKDFRYEKKVLRSYVIITTCN